MVDRAELADLLDCWEEQQEQNPRLTLDEFIAGSCHNTPPPLLADFRKQVAKLEAMDRRLERIGADDTGADIQANEHTDSARAQDGPLSPGAEPIPGYVLIERLGKGGFGEVWKASSPGGFSVALKFVHADENAAKIERRALETIKAVRHPHLLSIFGAWRVDGRVVIASELADGTLLDRLKEASNEGKPGIPQGELLEYFAEAAKGIDFLNRPKAVGGHGIQHRDIKPQNILLFGGSVKVGDFGLARSMQHSTTGHTGSLTLAFAAPEFLEGKTSDRSDQYSLAMTWCYLRTGKLPFEGTQAQVIAGHLHRKPDLSMLPTRERPAVERALAKNPRERWCWCSDLVEALRKEAVHTPDSRERLSTLRPRWNQAGFWGVIAALLFSVAAVSPFVLPKSDGIPAGSPAPNRPKGDLDSHSGDSAESGSLALASERHLPDITAGLVSHWTFDEVKGGLLTDAAGSLHGQVHGSPHPVSGVRGGALLFDGRRDYITMPQTAFPDQLTITVWIRPGESAASLCIFATKPADFWSGNGYPNGIALFLNSNTAPANRHIHFQIHRATVSTADAGFAFNEWTHLAVSVDKVNRQVGLFINGKAWEHPTIRRGPAPRATPTFAREDYTTVVVSELADNFYFQSDWRIGAFNEASTVRFPFLGAIDDMRLYDRVLSAEEIAALASRSMTD